MNQRATSLYKAVYIGLFINTALIIFKIIAGVMGRSAAIIADAVHSMSDFITDIVLLLGFSASNKPEDKGHKYGHGKIETMTSLVIGVALFLAGGKILLAGCRELAEGAGGKVLTRPGWISFYAAAASVVLKEWIYRYSLRVARKINSPSLEANAWHHRSDAFSSMGVMIGIGGAILLGNRWHVLDPLAAIIVSFFIIKVSVQMIIANGNELVEASLGDEVENQILNIVQTVPRVHKPHKLKTRRIGSNISINLHIKVDKNLTIVEAHDVCSQIEHDLSKAFGEDTFVTVHAEPLL